MPLAWGQATSKHDLLKLSSVELQWEDSPGAAKYEVEVFNSKDKKLKSFTSNTSLFKFKSTSGKIKIRGRVIDVYGKKGDWSTLIDIVVPPDDLKFPNDPNAKPITASASNASLKGRVKLEWPVAIQAKRYLIKVYDKDKKVVIEKKVTSLSEKVDLDIGAYTFSITPIGNDQIAGKEIMSPRNIQIGSAQLPMEKFVASQKGKSWQIQMPKRPELQIIGDLEYANHLSEVWTSVLKYNPFTDPVWSPEAKLKPGRYRIAFWVSKTGWLDSDKFRYEFVVKPTEAEINEPEAGSQKTSK